MCWSAPLVPTRRWPGGTSGPAARRGVLGLGVQPAHLHGVGNSSNGQEVGRGPHVALLTTSHGQDLLEGLDHDLLELLVDDLLRPMVSVEVLDPLEVADR